MNALIAIVGPTAAGKSSLALYLAQYFPLEVINADSRQVYRFMDIGTAKPTAHQRSQLPHHLIDVIDPDQQFSLALYLRMAREAIDQVQGRGKIPLLVGGSGQYVWAVLEGWKIPPTPPNENLRKDLEEKACRRENLYLKLKEIDPQAASKIDPRNIRRVIRALEVCLSLGSFSYWRTKQPPPFPIYIIGLNLPRQELYHRIDFRVERMVKNGWVEEVEKLLSMGYGPHLPSLSSLGYRQLIDYLEGKQGLEEVIKQIKWRTHNFARHQYAWFRPTDPRISWFWGGEESFPAIKLKVAEFLHHAFREKT